MIQEKYQIPVAQRGLDAILIHLGQVLTQVKKSQVYREASSVFVKILLPQIPIYGAEKIHEAVQEQLPKAVIMGMSTNLFGNLKENAALFMSACYFRESSVCLLEYAGRPEHYKTVGREFGRRIAGMKDVKGVGVYGVALNVDLSRFVIGVTEDNPDVPFFGALAAALPKIGPEVENNFDSVLDEDTKLDSYILGTKLYDTGLVMAVFSGKNLSIQAECILGWKPVGKELTVTKAVSKTCVETIDNMPAAQIFQKYLHIPLDDRFLENSCEFPMILQRDGFLTARTPPYVSSDGKLFFSADIHEGEKVRLSYANPQELLQEAREGSERMRLFQPQGIFLCGCMNRGVFLKEDAPKEFACYRRILPQLSACYGAGEIFRWKGQGGVLNSSLLVVGMREGPLPETEIPPLETEENLRAGRSIPLTTRLASFLDATTRELQEMVDAAQSASVAKSQFLSNMSHEIRTPINAILGMDEMILRESKEPSVIEYAENIRLAGSNLLGLINDILDFSKIESGKLDILPVEYELSSLLNDLINMVQSRAEKKGLSLAVSSDPDVPNMLYGDEIRIKQVITNILTNAVKYTERGFVALTVDYEKKDEETILLKISVKDSGIGIKEEDMKKLFTAFERIEEKRNRSIEGSGLGMNITRQLLALMDAELKVESTYGKGSTFSFVLSQKVVNWKPMGDFDEAYHRSLAQREGYSESFTAPDAELLVVDDTPMNLTVVKGLLKQTLVKIDTAQGGFECLDMVARKKYDIVFLDHRMPGMDGIETLKRMKAMEENVNKETPVISLTANAVSGAREEYIAAGFQDYLTKPIDGHQLEVVIQKYLPPEKLMDSQVGTEKKEEALSSEEAEPVLPNWLFQVPGLDTAEGIAHCGSAEAYREALAVFAEAIVPSSKEIAHFFEVEDWDNFTTKVHALKSSARIIGAKELSDRAKYLEYAGNHGYVSEIRYCADDLLQIYLTYAFHLAPLCAKEPAAADKKEKPLMEAPALAEAYETLREVAASFDYDSIIFVLQSLEDYRLPDADEARIRALREAAKKPDWERVRELLG